MKNESTQDLSVETEDGVGGGQGRSPQEVVVSAQHALLVSLGGLLLVLTFIAVCAIPGLKEMFNK